VTCLNDDDDDDDNDDNDNNDSNDASWYAVVPVRLRGTGCYGTVRVLYVILCSWYHPSANRHVAESLLMQNGTEGSYLLRPSKSPGTYTLSVRYISLLTIFLSSPAFLKFL